MIRDYDGLNELRVSSRLRVVPLSLSRAAIFFSHVTLDGLSERGTTRRLRVQQKGGKFCSWAQRITLRGNLVVRQV